MLQNNANANLASLWKRMLAFLLDVFFVLCFFRFALFPVFIAKNWDIFLNFQKTIVIPSISVIIFFLFKDSLGGVSIGKYFFSIGVRKIEKNTPKASFLLLLQRNIPLLLLPIEFFLLIFDKYGRRGGDRFAGTFVLFFRQELQKNPIRWLSKRVVCFIFLIALTVAGYFLTAPLQVKKSYAYEVTKKELENDENLLQNFGKIVKYSYWVEFYYDKAQSLHIQYSFFGQHFKGKAHFKLDFDKEKYYHIKEVEILKVN